MNKASICVVVRFVWFLGFPRLMQSDVANEHAYTVQYMAKSKHSKQAYLSVSEVYLAMKCLKV